MKKGQVLKSLFSASFVFAFALCAMVTVSGKDASAAEDTVTAADGSEFRFSVGTLLLRREETANHVIISSAPELGATPGSRSKSLNGIAGSFGKILESKSLTLDDYMPGLDISAAYKSKGGLEANFRYFGLNDWSEDVHKTTTSSFLHYKDSSFTVGGVPAENFVSYGSTLESGEINLGWWPVKQVGVFIGPRYIKLDENLTIIQGRFSSTSFAFGHQISTSNELLGGQVGVKTDLFKTRRGCTASLWGNAGYYDNAISAKVGAQFPSMSLSLRANDSVHTGTFAYGAGFNYKIVIVPHIALTTGYEMLSIDKVAVAPAQIHGTSLSKHKINIDTEDVLYHGAKVALTIDW